MGEVELGCEGDLVSLPATNRQDEPGPCIDCEPWCVARDEPGPCIDCEPGPCIVLMTEAPPGGEVWGVLFVSVGAVLGALARWKIQQGIAGLDGSWTRWATLGINATGSCLLGAIVALVDQKAIAPPVGLSVGTGFCGAFTTFSTFAVDVIKSMSATDYAGGAALLLLTNALSLGGAALSYCVIAGCPAAAPRP